MDALTQWTPLLRLVLNAPGPLWLAAELADNSGLAFCIAQQLNWLISGAVPFVMIL